MNDDHFRDPGLSQNPRLQVRAGASILSFGYIEVQKTTLWFNHTFEFLIQMFLIAYHCKKEEVIEHLKVFASKANILAFGFWAPIYSI